MVGGLPKGGPRRQAFEAGGCQRGRFVIDPNCTADVEVEVGGSGDGRGSESSQVV